MDTHKKERRNIGLPGMAILNRTKQIIGTPHGPKLCNIHVYLVTTSTLVVHFYRKSGDDHNFNTPVVYENFHFSYVTNPN